VVKAELVADSESNTRTIVKLVNTCLWDLSRTGGSRQPFPRPYYSHCSLSIRV